MKLENKKSIIKVTDLTVTYDEKPVLFDVDIDFLKGEKTAIIGPNGVGKSTLIKAMLGFIKPITGKVMLEGKEIISEKNRISYVPQTESVNWDFPISVLEVVMMGDFKVNRLFSRFTNDDKKRAIEALKKVKMEEYKDSHISELSGGQKRRVFIARSLNQDADVFILDEPFAGVDKETEKIIVDKFNELKNIGKSIIVVHHDFNTLEKYFDRVVLIDKVVKMEGTVKDVFKNIEEVNSIMRR